MASKFLEGKTGDHQLIPLVEELLRESGVDWTSLDRTACVVGPGGFTSLRIAVAFCNTLGDQLDIPLAGVHLRDVYRARVGSGEVGKWGNGEMGKWGNGEVVWVHSTKKDEVFMEDGSEVIHCSLGEAAEKMGDRKWIGELISEHQERLGEGADLHPIVEILPGFLSEQSYEKKPLEPWYGRGW